MYEVSGSHGDEYEENQISSVTWGLNPLQSQNRAPFK
jgi:hypothetical protein